MNRCQPTPQRALSRWALPGFRALPRTLPLTLSLTLTLALACGATAQAEALPRSFPDAALRGTLTVLQPPEISLDGQPARLSPGARIRNVNNTLALSGTLVGQPLTVNYVRDGQGLVHEVWVLSPLEAAQKRRSAAD